MSRPTPTMATETTETVATIAVGKGSEKGIVRETSPVYGEFKSTRRAYSERHYQQALGHAH